MIKKNSKKLHEGYVSNGSLRSVFEELQGSKGCPVSKYILNLEAVEPNARHYFMCDIFSMLAFKCEGNEVLLSFIPKDKIEAGVKADDLSKLRQLGKPAKVANTLINDKRPFEKIFVVNVMDQVAGPAGKMIPKKKTFWLDEEEGLAYNDSENVFEIADAEILATKKTGNKQYTLFRKDSFENFANYMKNNFLCNFEFKVFRGRDVATYYKQENYFKGKGEKGSLWGSCMRHVDKGKYDFYTENPEVIGLLGVVFEGKLLGRALLWTSATGELIMDRIYSYEDYIQQAFLDYAVENGITHKANYTSAGQHTKWMVYNKETGKHERKDDYPIDILVKYPWTMFANYPWIDTFEFTNGERYDILDNKAIVTNYRYTIDGRESRNQNSSSTIKGITIPPVYLKAKEAAITL